MSFFFRLSAMLFFAILVTSCQERIQPIYVPADIAMPEALHTASLADISQAIVEGGTLAGWKMTPVSPGKVHATWNIRTHQADVDVDFTTTKYSITYVSSKNLLSQGARIHKAYNQWVRELETGINTGLYEVSVKRRPNTTTAAPSDAATTWFSIQNSTDPKVFLNYMERYPESEYTPLARARLTALLDRLSSGGDNKLSFDPTGKWRVVASYKGDIGNTSWCARSQTWEFILNFRKGRISETYWSGKAPLYVNGENSDDLIDLNFDFPGGGSHWKWRERFRLDSNDKRFTATSMGGAASGCQGTIGVHMKKIGSQVNAEKSPPATKPQMSEAERAWIAIRDNNDERELRSFLKNYLDSDYAEIAIRRLNALIAANAPNAPFNPVGKWKVFATYRGHNGNAAYCPNGEKWEFVLDVSKQRMSKEVWSGRNALYVTGKSAKKGILLNVDVPHGGSNWQWSESFKLDQKQKHFLAEAKQQGGAYGGCSGKLSVTMTKLS